MRRYFLDTWFLIARFSRTDHAHTVALRLWQAHRGDRLLTHDGVLTEFLTFFADSGMLLRRGAVRFVRDLAPEVDVVAQDRVLFLSGLDLYERRGDKEYSLVDCMSMQLMRARGITHVLTNDHHFRQEGFTVVSE
jgi:predicted nucleic acid-binding protein